MRRPGLGAARAGEGVRLVEEPDRLLAVQQRADDVLARQQQGGVPRVVVPALPGGRVQHGRNGVRQGPGTGTDTGQLRASHLDDVVIPYADVGQGVAVAPGPAGGPHLVVDLAVRVDAGQLVAVAVADEDVLHGRHPQHVDVLADVGRVERHPYRGQVQVHQVDAAGHAQHGNRGGPELAQDGALAQEDQRAALQLPHGLQPHVDLVGRVAGSGEVQDDGRPVHAQPVVDRGEDLRVRRREAAGTEVRQQHGEVGEGAGQGEGETDVGEDVAVGDHGHQHADHGEEVQVQHLLGRTAHQPLRRSVGDGDVGQVDVARDHRQLAAQPDQGDHRALRHLERVEGQQAGDRHVEEGLIAVSHARQQQDQQQLTHQEADGETGAHRGETVDEVAAAVVQIAVSRIGDQQGRDEDPHIGEDRRQHDAGVSKADQERGGQFRTAADTSQTNGFRNHEVPLPKNADSDEFMGKA